MTTSSTPTASSSRHRLLSTSADLFWTRGYRATTTRQIAAVLGLQQASLYHHVASKDDLLVEICRMALGELLAAAERSLADVSDPRTRLEHLVRTSLRTQLGNQRAHATMVFEMRAVPGRHRDELGGLCARYRALVETTILEAQRAGVVRSDVEARHVALSLGNLMCWTLLWYRQDGELGPDALASCLLDLWCHGVASPRRREPVAPPPPSSRSLRDPAAPGPVRTADRVLDAAAALFRTKGYHATSAREIATVLGIQKASLYHHTPSKSHLLYEVCARAQQQMREHVRTTVDAVAAPLDRVRTMAATHVSTLLRHQDQHAASLLELRALSGDQRRTIVGLLEEYEALVRAVIEDARRAGVVRSDMSAGLLSQFLFSLTNRSMLWFRADGSLSPEQWGALFSALYLQGVTTAAADA